MSTEIPKTMKAIQVHENGGPEVIQMKEVPVPTPKEDEVLIKVQWTGTNFIDTYFRSGLYKRPLPFTLGQDALGILLSVPSSPPTPFSSSIPALKVGQLVLTPSPGTGSFAEYLAVPWHKVAPVPDDLNAILGSKGKGEGVAACTTGFTAAYLTKESYKVQKGDWVLVRAAAGSLGTAVCQICSHLGANVIGTVSTEEKAKIAKENGAHHVLLTTTPSEENVKTVLELTGGKGVDVVYDGVGKDTFEEDFLVVRSKGNLVMCGNASGAPPDFSVLKLSPKCLKLSRPTLGPYIATPEEFGTYAEEVFDYIRKRVLKFPIFKEYPFTAEGIAQSQKDIASRGTVGKLVIKVSE